MSKQKDAVSESDKTTSDADKAMSNTSNAGETPPPQAKGGANQGTENRAAGVDDINPVAGVHNEKLTTAASTKAEADKNDVNKKAGRKKDKPAAKPKSSIDKPVKPIRIPWTAVLALLLSIGIGLGVGYGVYTNDQQLQLLKQKAQQAGRTQDANHQALLDQIAKLRNDLNQTEAQNQQLLDQLNASAQERQTIQQSLDALSEKLTKQGRGPRLWRIAEVEYLLNIANQRLMLERDVKTALQALADADVRLESIADPALIPVRRDIASEMTALKAVQLPDIDGMAVTLQGLVDNIEHLPLINKEHVFHSDEKTETAKSWRDIPGKLWSDIKGLVTIHRNQPKVERLLPPQEAHYLYQNLGLKLEQARIALLQQNTTLFKRNLSDTQTWIKRYFDPDATAVSSVIDTLTQLASVDLQPKLPDISASLRTLRDWSVAQQSHATRKPVLPHRVAVVPKPAKPSAQHIPASPIHPASQ